MRKFTSRVVFVVSSLLVCSHVVAQTPAQQQEKANAQIEKDASEMDRQETENAKELADDYLADALAARLACVQAGATSAQLQVGDDYIEDGDHEYGLGLGKRTAGRAYYDAGLLRWLDGLTKWAVGNFSGAVTDWTHPLLGSNQLFSVDAYNAFDDAIYQFSRAWTEYSNAESEFAMLLLELQMGM